MSKSLKVFLILPRNSLNNSTGKNIDKSISFAGINHSNIDRNSKMCKQEPSHVPHSDAAEHKSLAPLMLLHAGAQKTPFHLLLQIKWHNCVSNCSIQVIWN